MAVLRDCRCGQPWVCAPPAQSCPGTKEHLEYLSGSTAEMWVDLLVQKGIAYVHGLVVRPGPAGGEPGSHLESCHTWTYFLTTVWAAPGEIKDVWLQTLVWNGLQHREAVPIQLHWSQQWDKFTVIVLQGLLGQKVAGSAERNVFSCCLLGRDKTSCLFQLGCSSLMFRSLCFDFISSVLQIRAPRSALLWFWAGNIKCISLAQPQAKDAADLTALRAWSYKVTLMEVW